MQAAVEAARPLIEMLWQREVEVTDLDTPERRAAFDQRLRAALRRITDGSVRDHYAAEIKRRRAELFRPASSAPARREWQPDRPRGAGRSGGVGRGRAMPPAMPMANTRKSELARSGTSGHLSEARIREAGILLTACHNPGALAPVETALEEMVLRTPEYGPIRDALLSALAEESSDVVEAIRARHGSGPAGGAGPVAPSTCFGIRPARIRRQSGLSRSWRRQSCAIRLPSPSRRNWPKPRATCPRPMARIGPGVSVRRVTSSTKRGRHALKDEVDDSGGTVSEIQRLLDNRVYKAKKN